MRILCSTCNQIKPEDQFNHKPWQCDHCYFKSLDLPYTCPTCGTKWVNKENMERCCDGKETSNVHNPGDVQVNPTPGVDEKP